MFRLILMLEELGKYSFQVQAVLGPECGLWGFC